MKADAFEALAKVMKYGYEIRGGTLTLFVLDSLIRHRRTEADIWSGLLPMPIHIAELKYWRVALKRFIL